MLGLITSPEGVFSGNSCQRDGFRSPLPSSPKNLGFRVLKSYLIDEARWFDGQKNSFRRSAGLHSPSPSTPTTARLFSDGDARQKRSDDQGDNEDEGSSSMKQPNQLMVQGFLFAIYQIAPPLNALPQFPLRAFLSFASFYFLLTPLLIIFRTSVTQAFAYGTPVYSFCFFLVFFFFFCRSYLFSFSFCSLFYP